MGVQTLREEIGPGVGSQEETKTRRDPLSTGGWGRPRGVEETQNPQRRRSRRLSKEPTPVLDLYGPGGPWFFKGWGRGRPR